MNSPSETKVEELKDGSGSDTPKLKLDVFRPHFKYVFLEEGDNKWVNFNSSLST